MAQVQEYTVRWGYKDEEAIFNVLFPNYRLVQLSLDVSEQDSTKGYFIEQSRALILTSTS